MIMNYSGPGLWVVSQVMLLLYFKMDNGSNVCGIEFNYDNTEENKTVSRNINSTERESHDGANLLDADVFFGAKIPHQLEGVSEEGRYGSIILSCQCSIIIFFNYLLCAVGLTLILTTRSTQKATLRRGKLKMREQRQTTCWTGWRRTSGELESAGARLVRRRISSLRMV